MNQNVSKVEVFEGAIATHLKKHHNSYYLNTWLYYASCPYFVTISVSIQEKSVGKNRQRHRIVDVKS